MEWNAWNQSEQYMVSRVGESNEVKSMPPVWPLSNPLVTMHRRKLISFSLPYSNLISSFVATDEGPANPTAVSPTKHTPLPPKSQVSDINHGHR